MYFKFIRAIKYNSLSALLYKTLLFIHSTLLYFFISKAEYGIIASLFSSIYFLISITNFGTEKYLLLNFSNKKNNNYFFILSQLFYKIFSLIFIIFIFLFFQKIFNLKHFIIFSFLKNNKIESAVFIYLILIFFLESFKKFIYAFYSLSFLNKQLFFIENSSLIIYISIIWSNFLTFKKISLILIFKSLFYILFLENIVLLFVFLNTIKLSFPSFNIFFTNYFFKKNKSLLITIKIYFLNYISELSKSFFSPNFIILICAYKLNFITTGKIKFFINFSLFFYTLLSKSIASPTIAFLTNLNNYKTNSNKNKLKTKQAFIKLTKPYFLILYFALLLFSINLLNLFLYKNLLILSISSFFSTSTLSNFFIISLFILNSITENLFSIYEHFLLLLSNNFILFILNSFSIFILFFFLFFNKINNSIFIITLIFFIRFLSTLFLILFSYFKYFIYIKTHHFIKIK